MVVDTRKPSHGNLPQVTDLNVFHTGGGYHIVRKASAGDIIMSCWSMWMISCCSCQCLINSSYNISLLPRVSCWGAITKPIQSNIIRHDHYRGLPHRRPTKQEKQALETINQKQGSSWHLWFSHILLYASAFRAAYAVHQADMVPRPGNHHPWMTWDFTTGSDTFGVNLVVFCGSSGGWLSALNDATPVLLPKHLRIPPSALIICWRVVEPIATGKTFQLWRD